MYQFRLFEQFLCVFNVAGRNRRNQFRERDNALKRSRAWRKDGYGRVANVDNGFEYVAMMLDGLFYNLGDQVTSRRIVIINRIIPGIGMTVEISWPALRK